MSNLLPDTAFKLDNLFVLGQATSLIRVLDVDSIDDFVFFYKVRMIEVTFIPLPITVSNRESAQKELIH